MIFGNSETKRTCLSLETTALNDNCETSLPAVTPLNTAFMNCAVA